MTVATNCSWVFIWSAACCTSVALASSAACFSFSSRSASSLARFLSCSSSRALRVCSSSSARPETQTWGQEASSDGPGPSARRCGHTFLGLLCLLFNLPQPLDQLVLLSLYPLLVLLGLLALLLLVLQLCSGRAGVNFLFSTWSHKLAPQGVRTGFKNVVPLHLFLVLLLSGLSLHLLHFNGVRLSPPHVQLVVSHTQRQDALVDPQPWSVEHKVLHGAKNIRYLWRWWDVTCQTSARHLLELSCRWVWWQTSCHWRKCFWFHSKGSRSLARAWGDNSNKFQMSFSFKFVKNGGPVLLYVASRWRSGHIDDEWSHWRRWFSSPALQKRSKPLMW